MRPENPRARRSARTDPRRRRSLAALAAVLSSIGAAPRAAVAQASDWPARPVRFVVNFPPGGPLDLTARAVAERVSAALKQPVVVENRPGAAGNLGAEAVARAAPDGYTVLFSIDTPLTVNPTIYPSMAFKPGDFRPLALLGTSGSTVVVHPGAGVATLAELIAKARREEMTFASAGNGSPGHLTSAILADGSGARIVHVPYKGNAPAVTAVVGGEVQAGILATPGVLPHVQAGKLRALAVTGRQRSPLLPDVPTAAQAGLPALEYEVLYLALAPAGVPDAVFATLRNEIAAAVRTPEVQERLSRLDLQASGETGAAVEERIARLRERYAPIVRKTGMKVE